MQALHQRGFYPVTIKPIKKYKNISKIPILPYISSKDFSIFCRQYSSMLKAGVPSAQGLYLLLSQTQNPVLQQSLERVYFLVQGGHSLSQAMLKQDGRFPLVLIKAIESGEWSGSLELSFHRMADYFERQYKLQQKVRKALSYPILLFVIAIVIISFLLRIVIPQFVVLFENAQTTLPIYTRILLAISEFFLDNASFLALLPAILFLAYKFSLAYNKSRIFLHGLLLKIPFIKGLVSKVVSARFNRTVSILLSAGIPITQSLTIASNATGNELIRSKLTQAVTKVQQGRSLAGSLESLNLFPAEVINIIAIGEESGQIQEMMDKIADICDMEAETAIDKFISLLEPLSILILGGIIAFIVIAVVMPMFEMYVFLD